MFFLTVGQHDYTVVGDADNVPVFSLVSGNFTNNDMTNTLFYYAGDTGNVVFPVFGEAKPTNASLNPTLSGLSDTGLVQRALLPLSQSMNRTAVRLYTGNAMVLDSRTVCMPPSINGSVSMFAPYGTDHALGQLDGVLLYGSALKQATSGVSSLCDDGECEHIGFSCPLTASSVPSSSFCSITTVGGFIYENTPSWNPLEPAWSQNNPIFLVFSTNMDNDSWATFENKSEPLEEGTAYGEWQSFEPLPGRFVNASLCFLAYGMDRYYVHMETSGGLAEPSDPWSVSLPYYDTTATRRYLGLLPDQDTEDYVGRGILELEITGASEQNTTGSSAESASNLTAIGIELGTQNLLYATMYSLMTNSFNSSLPTCRQCGSLASGNTIRGELILVLKDVLSTTGRAASMLQSYVTMTAFWIYTSMLSSMGTAETVELAMTSVVRTPGPCWDFDSAAGPFTARECPGYAAVTVLLGVHLLTVVAITVQFTRQVRFSRCASIWHAIAQLAVSGGLRDHWDRGTDLSDAEYERLVEGTTSGRDYDKRLVRLVRTEETGRVEFVGSGSRSVTK